MPLARRLLVLVLLAALALAGCGDSSEDEATAPASTSTPTPEATPAPTKPEVEVPRGKAPERLVKKDLVVGTGPAAKAGESVSVHYVGVSYLNGRQFDASWDTGQPFSFQLGAGQVIPGWDQGVAGMKVGGRRRLVIPPDLAYGPQGSPPAIGPNETLVFVVDLLAIQ
jgi:peptidylprolyl isomerase